MAASNRSSCSCVATAKQANKGRTQKQPTTKNFRMDNRTIHIFNFRIKKKYKTHTHAHTQTHTYALTRAHIYTQNTLVRVNYSNKSFLKKKPFTLSLTFFTPARSTFTFFSFLPSFLPRQSIEGLEDFFKKNFTRLCVRTQLLEPLRQAQRPLSKARTA